MSVDRLSKWAPLSGIVMVVLWVVGILDVTSGFGYTATPAQALHRFSQDPVRVQRGALLAGYLAPVFLIWFAGSLFSALREGEAESGPLPAIAFGGGVVCSIALVLGYGVLWVAATRAGRVGSLSADYAVVMNDLYSIVLANVLSVGLVAFIGATGIASLRSGIFPAWLGWVSVVFGLGLLTPIHWIFEGLSTIWVIVVSLLLYKRNQGIESDPTGVPEEG